MRGQSNLNPERSLAIVGTRSANPYGINCTREIVTTCSDFNATIVSGLAYGIDVAAHKQALKLNLTNYAVIAGGIDQLYPKVHQKIADKICRNGAILSEQLPGTRPEAYLFPMRNRIIAGLSDATMVIEAAKKGGALITANIAYSYDKSVFAVPGKLNEPFSEGCNQLIQSQKALIYTGAETLAYNLNWTSQKHKNTQYKTLRKKLTTPKKIIYDLLLTADYMSIDELSIKAKIEMNQMANVLIALEFKDIIQLRPGKKYELRNKFKDI
jgi:DNA processing protein